MNYLFHLYLSGDDPDILTGSLMGDFVKGPLGERYPAGIRNGIELHRRIDSFAQNEPHFTRSRHLLGREFGLYRGIMVDLYYDHFLASGWEDYCDVPLEQYLVRTRRIVERQRFLLPQRLTGLLPVIFEEMIPSYLTVEGVARALSRMSGRITRRNPLAAGGRELTRHYGALQEDFLQFLPRVSHYVSDVIASQKARN